MELLTEYAVQKSIVEYLTILESHYRGFTFWSVPNEGAGGNGVRGRKLKTTGAKKGQPDLEVLYNGKLLLLEVKKDAFLDKKKGVLSKEQKERHQRLKNAGAKIEVVYSVDDVINIMKEWQR